MKRAKTSILTAVPALFQELAKTLKHPLYFDAGVAFMQKESVAKLSCCRQSALNSPTYGGTVTYVSKG